MDLKLPISPSTLISSGRLFHKTDPDTEKARFTMVCCSPDRLCLKIGGYVQEHTTLTVHWDKMELRYAGSGTQKEWLCNEFYALWATREGEINTGVISSRLGCKENYAHCSIQQLLKLLKRAGWQVHKKRIAVVYSSWYQAVDKCGAWILSEISSDLANASKVKNSSLTDCWNVLFEKHSIVKSDSNIPCWLLSWNRHLVNDEAFIPLKWLLKMRWGN